MIAPDLAESSGFRERFSREARDRRRARRIRTSSPSTTPARSTARCIWRCSSSRAPTSRAMLATDGRLKPYRAIDVCRQVGDALDAAHAQGLIHRDVKPANVLIEGRNAYPDRLRADQAPRRRRGVTMRRRRRRDDPLRRARADRGREVTARSDVYSLGCVLYHCLTGRMPFERDTDVAVIYAHLSEPPPRPSRVRPDLPDGLRRRDRQGAGQGTRSAASRPAAELMAAARAVVDAAGPAVGDAPAAARERPPRAAIAEEVRATRAARACCSAGVDASTRAIAHVALGGRVDMREAAQRGRAGRRPRRAAGSVILGAARDRRRAARGPADARLEGAAGGRRERRAATRARRAPTSGSSTPFSPLQLQVKLRKLLGADAVGA